MPGSTGAAAARATSRVANLLAQRREPRLGEEEVARAAHRAEAEGKLGRSEQAARLQCRARDGRVHERADDLDRIAAVEDAQALQIQPARRRRIEDDAPAERRLGAQDDVIPTRSDHRLGKAQLGVVALARQSRCDRLRPDVRRHRRRQLGGARELDVEPVGDRIVPGSDEHVATAEVAALERRQVDRDALPCCGGFDRRVVHLHASHAHDASARLEPQQVAGRDRARPQRPRRDRADAAE